MGIPSSAEGHRRGCSLVRQLAQLFADSSQYVGGSGLVDIADCARQGESADDCSEHQNCPIVAVLGARRFETVTCQIYEAFDAAVERCLEGCRLSMDF